MSYEAFSFIAIFILAAVHLYAPQALARSKSYQGQFLSFGGGVAIAYVFIDLLPKLDRSNALVQTALQGVFPYFERHVFIMALLGFLLFFSLERKKNPQHPFQKFWITMGSYAFFNFLVGYAVVEKDNPEVQPLALFTIAMGLHYFTNDYALTESYKDMYRNKGKWILVASLFVGWFFGYWIKLSEVAVALISAFIGGGVIMNVTRHELPSHKPNNVRSFLYAAIAYSLVLLILRA